MPNYVLVIPMGKHPTADDAIRELTDLIKNDDFDWRCVTAVDAGTY